MRTIVIGDIHGSYNELKILIEGLKEKRKYNPNRDRLIFLGDYIDRGENSRMVIRYIQGLQEENKRVVALMGNHENMLLDYLENPAMTDWLYNGYHATLESYIDYAEELDSDIDWMETLPLYYEDKNFIYVHAGVDKNQPMDNQKKHTLLWTRERFFYNRKKYHKTIIFGHTPTMNLCYNQKYKPISINGSIALDTGCVFGGCLTALIIKDGVMKEYYQIRKGETEIMKENIQNIQNKEPLIVMGNAFYGNGIAIMDIPKDKIDMYILGEFSNYKYVKDANGKLVKVPIKIDESEIDRSIIDIPDTDYVIVYNDIEERKVKELRKPLIYIPETNINIYSRSFICRFNKTNNELESLVPDDYTIIKKYFVA